MELFVIQSVDSTIKFELCKEAEWDGEYGSCIAKIKYECRDRTIFSESVWWMEVWTLRVFIIGMRSMYKNLQGEAKLCTEWDSSLVMKMVGNDGHISVDIKDGKDGEYDDYLHISFNIDQSYLPELIKQAETLCPPKKSLLQRLGLLK